MAWARNCPGHSVNTPKLQLIAVRCKHEATDKPKPEPKKKVQAKAKSEYVYSILAFGREVIKSAQDLAGAAN